MTRKTVLKYWLWVVAAAFGAASATAEVKTDVNLVPAIRAAGTYPTYWSTADQGARTNVGQLFDGVVWATSETDRRWIIGAFKSNGADPMGTRVVLTVPDAYEPGSRLVLKRYRLFRCPYWAQANRFITRWSVWGIPDGETSDTNKWQKLDERVWPKYDASLVPECWPTSGNAPEGETNSFDCATVASRGFRAFAFVPQGSTFYDQAVADPSKVQDNDMELFQIEYDVDIYDYPLCSTITNDLDFAFDDAQAQGFSPALGSSLNVSQTVSAPDIHDYLNSHTYRPRGYRIERFDFANDVWTNRLEVTDGTSAFTYEVPSDPAAKERIVWLYERSAYYTDPNPIQLSKYLEERGVNGKTYTSEPNNADIAEGPKTLFDGVTYLENGEWYRWRALLSKNPWSKLTLPSGATGVPLYDGDLFYFSKYRIYMTSMGSNERKRAPTAWTLKTGVGASEPETLADTRSGVDWSTISYNVRGANYQEFELEQTVAFNKILFTPTDSAAHQAGDSANTVSLLEVDIWGNVANPKGTLRVLQSRQDIVSNGFSPAIGTLLTEAGTLTAPNSVREDGEKYPCVGYRLEWFDETACQWKLDHESDERAFSFTPDGDKAYRLIWGIGWQTCAPNGLVIHFR